MPSIYCINVGGVEVNFKKPSRGSRIWISNMRLFFQPPTATRLLGSVVVKQVALFTMLLSFRQEEMKSDIFCFILQTYINSGINRDRPNYIIVV